eukprot:CAMPEP_0115352088 /NCGR_PEP_ID=MMETSP0270-20121206/97324_1 /TAXON_ID=71861 /ORGANISM="Scrippsiella trochoidea, Strain CCMP3099" /LENGTH=48 /DNA_ID= /DNA_START= /DNA_END= /DNA_ORIENTATION=
MVAAASSELLLATHGVDPIRAAKTTSACAEHSSIGMSSSRWLQNATGM